MEENDQPAKKRRRLCLCCNQWLARTTYWEHQKRYCGTSIDYVNTTMEDSSSDSEFELNYGSYIENDLGFDDNHGIIHDNEPQREHSEPDEGMLVMITLVSVFNWLDYIFYW